MIDAIKRLLHKRHKWLWTDCALCHEKLMQLIEAGQVSTIDWVGTTQNLPVECRGRDWAGIVKTMTQEDAERPPEDRQVGPGSETGPNHQSEPR